MTHRTSVRGIPAWAEPARLLGPGAWTLEGAHAHATLSTFAAADLDARLRGVGIGGAALSVTAEPPLPRASVRAARTADARRRRDATPGFTRPGTRVDEEGRWSLTPEALALTTGERAGGRRVIDAGCGAGGNTIGFARAGCRVTAIESDRRRLADARHNARVYGVEDRVSFVLGRAEELLPRLDADLLFLDPPWGRAWSRTRTTLADLPGLGALLPYARRFAEVWLKVPPSFDPAELPGSRPEAVYGLARGDERRVKFLVLRWCA